MDTQQLVEVTDVIWVGFKKLLPITMSHHSYGLVAASKILFAIFPEIVLLNYVCGMLLSGLSSSK